MLLPLEYRFFFRFCKINGTNEYEGHAHPIYVRLGMPITFITSYESTWSLWDGEKLCKEENFKDAHHGHKLSGPHNGRFGAMLYDIKSRMLLCIASILGAATA